MTKRTIQRPSAIRRASKGFSLVEVLVSILVLCFGVLGMVGLQAAALQGNRDARLQSTAIGLSRELADLARGNKDVAQTQAEADNPFLGDFTGTPLQPRTVSACLQPGNVCAPTPSSPLDGQRLAAAAAMTEWLARVEAALPGARVRICFDAEPYDSEGAPQWTCTEAAGDPLVLKVGWSRQSTDRSGTNQNPVDRATVPSVVFTVAAGSPA